ncbi:single-stranded DNA-binding protein [Patescibacteria group bacterium]|nr:single-stranded DNA-binding protein [Patescibacteria group bacterium]
MDLNKAMVIGRLTRDPESRTTPSGQTVTNFSVATNFKWTDQSGQKQERVEYHDVVAWRKLAEICAQYLEKGRRVYVEGRLQTRDWEGQDGVKRYRTEIVTDNMIMLDGGGGQGSGQSKGEPAPAIENKPQETPKKDDAPKPASNTSEEEVSIEDIPF